MMALPRSNNEIIPASEVRLSHLKYGWDEGVNLHFDESTFGNYYSKPFRAEAKLEIPPLDSGTTLQIGWIPLVTKFSNVHTYGKHGVCSVDIPELASGKNSMINISDKYPWCDNLGNMCEIVGPTETPQILTVYFVFNPDLKIMFELAVPNYESFPKFTFGHKKETIFAYLCIRDVTLHFYKEITAIKVTSEIAIDVDYSKPLGKRCQYIGPCEQEKAQIVERDHLPAMDWSFYQYCYSKLCIIVWRPSNAYPQILRPPTASTMDYISYCREFYIMNIVLPMTKESFMLICKKKLQNEKNEKNAIIGSDGLGK